MEKRKMIIGGYDTAASGLWTLGPWKLSDPVPKTNLITIPGSSVVLDLSDALTDGEPTYEPRTLTATFESSEGSRLDRKTRIEALVNQLSGRRVDIVLPDDPDRYITGRLSVRENYNDLAHASISIEATCDPWKYSDTETVVHIAATIETKYVTLINSGFKPVVPTITVEGGNVNLFFGEKTWALGEGTYILADIYMKTGMHTLAYSGEGTATLTYREAIL